MQSDSDFDKRLGQVWGKFCDDLKSAGDLVLRDTTPKKQVTRATGLRLLARNISLALQFELENKDPGRVSFGYPCIYGQRLWIFLRDP